MPSCHHREEADGRPALSLDAEALFLVGVLRAWTAAQRPHRSDATPDWRDIIALAGLPAEAAREFSGFMAIVLHGMRRPLDIRCCPCPQVGRDEEALLRIIGALQRGDRLTALDDLADWLQPEGVVPALRGAGRLAAVLEAHEVDLAAGAGLPPPARQAVAAQGARH